MEFQKKKKKIILINSFQAVDKIDFSNWLCHSLLYFFHQGIKRAFFRDLVPNICSFLAKLTHFDLLKS